MHDPVAIQIHRALREAIGQDYASQAGVYDLTGRVAAGQHVDPPLPVPCVAVSYPVVTSDPGDAPIGRYAHEAEYLIQGWVDAGASLEERGEAAMALYSDVLSGIMEDRANGGLHEIRGIRNVRFAMQVLQGDAIDIPGMPGFIARVTFGLDTRRGV